MSDINPTLLDKLMLTPDDSGMLPAAKSSEAASFTLKYYKNRPEMIANIFKSQDNKKLTILHKSADKQIVCNLFKVLENDDEALAEILSIKNAAGQTPLTYLRQSPRPNINETISLISEQIMKLATDSDLSIEKSIELLEANNMEPQVVEFLKLQQDDNILGLDFNQDLNFLYRDKNPSNKDKS